MSGVILMYHRVAAAHEDPYGLAVAPQRFLEHVDHLSRLGCVVPLLDILKPGRATKIAITFDDGYADNAAAAAPLLAQAGLPATYFITTGRLGGRRFWWDQLAEAFLGEHRLPPGIDVTVGDNDVWLALNDIVARETALRFLHRRLRPLPPDELQATVSDVLKRLDAPASSADMLSMTVEQLQELAASPLAEIGAHTRTHLQLAGQQASLQADEVVGSVSDLTNLLGRPVRSFAYPFGTKRATGKLAPRFARDAGCEVACTTDRGAVTGRAQAHRLPRLNVRNYGAAELASEIAQIVGLH